MWALAGFVALTLVMTYPLVARFASAIPGDSFDGWQNYWNLWWVKTALLEQHTLPWFTNVLHHPTGVSLLFHTLNAFNGFTFLPVQLAWGLIPAYNAVVVFSFAVGGLGAYLLAREVLGPHSSRLAAFVAGVVFAFSPYHVAHLLGHMQLIALEWIPFFALYLVRAAGTSASYKPGFSEKPGLYAQKPGLIPFHDAVMAVLFLALVALCDWYYVMYSLLLSALVVLWAVVRRRGIRQRAVGIVAAIWAVWALLFAPLLIPMVREATQFDFMEPDPQQFRILSADLLAFVTPQEFHPLWGEWAREQARGFTASVSEHQMFAGFTVLALATLGLVGARSARRPAHPATAPPRDSAQAAPIRVAAPGPRFWAVAAGAFFLLALGPVLHIGGRADILPGGAELPLPYALLQRLPFMSISRSVSRFDVMVMLALGVLAAGGVAWLGRRGRAGRGLALVALVLVIFEFLPAPYPMSPPDTPEWYRTLAADTRSGAVLNLPVNWDRPWYLLYQTEHGRPLTAAYISREDPRTLIDRAPVLQTFRHLGPDVIALDLAQQGQQVLADLDVRWVVVDRYKMPGGPEREVTTAAASEVFAGQAPVYADDRLTVYEVIAPLPEERRPYALLGVGWSPLDEATRTRSFAGSAPLIIHAAEAGKVTLRVVTAAGSAAIDLPRGAEGYELPVSVQAGDTVVTLRTVEPGAWAVVSQLMTVD